MINPIYFTTSDDEFERFIMNNTNISYPYRKASLSINSFCKDISRLTHKMDKDEIEYFIIDVRNAVGSYLSDLLLDYDIFD